MSFYIHVNWLYFCLAFGIMLLLKLVMSFQNRNFFTKHVVIRKFSMLDLEFPPSAEELVSFIKDIYNLPAQLAVKTTRALKTQLWLDFVFMPALYGSIFILSMKVSMMMFYIGHKLFAIFAWLQFIAWLCDIIENIYLLNKIRPDPLISTPFVHKSYEVLEIIKWGLPLLVAVCSVAAIFYFWLVGRYSYDSLNYIIITVIELILFFIVKKLTIKNEEKQLEEFQSS